MKRFVTALLAAAVAGALFVASPLIAAPKGTENYNKSTPTAGSCSDSGDSISIVAPTKLWPPNHKYYEDIHVTVIDDDAQSVTLTTMGTHNQYDGDTETNGSGHTADDIRANPDDTGASRMSADGAPEFIAEEIATQTVTTDWIARAERAGRDETKAGREYTLSASSRGTNGDTCTHEVKFTVPHDMRASGRTAG